MKSIRITLLLILVCVIGVVTSVSAQINSPPMAPNSPLPSATPPSTVQAPAVPEILKNPVLLQQILSKLTTETERANSAESQVNDLKINREEWKQTAQAEAARAKVLDEALAARREESTQLRTANGFIMTSLSEYKTEVTDLRKENDRLRASRKWYLVAGAAIGGGVSWAARR